MRHRFYCQLPREGPRMVARKSLLPVYRRGRSTPHQVLSSGSNAGGVGFCVVHVHFWEFNIYKVLAVKLCS